MSYLSHYVVQGDQHIPVYQTAPVNTKARDMNSTTTRPPIQCYKCSGPHKANECPLKAQAGQQVQCYGCAGPHYYKDCQYRHNNALPVTPTIAANVPFCSGCGIDHLNKDCSMRRAPIDASNPRTTSLNLLGIERGRIAQVSLNAITRMQPRAFTRKLHKKERQGQAGTSRNPKPQNNPARKQAIKVGKGKDKVIV